MNKARTSHSGKKRPRTPIHLVLRIELFFFRKRRIMNPKRYGHANAAGRTRTCCAGVFCHPHPPVTDPRQIRNSSPCRNETSCGAMVVFVLVIILPATDQAGGPTILPSALFARSGQSVRSRSGTLDFSAGVRQVPNRRCTDRVS